ncbi:hypothetical protein [Saccharopolyspora spinosa]|uniref:hypothetical protein n=1 Tax=Saccharopolyspora spinosa TaxID=60894 RepID=UPI0002EDF138|nr:hypothetical protein [Saccharopolyspora spinosa]
MSEHDGRQFVGIDLHRHRSVIVRQGMTGEQFGVVRIANDPMTLAGAGQAGPAPARQRPVRCTPPGAAGKAPLDGAYRARVNSRCGLIDAFGFEIERTTHLITGKLAQHPG